MTTSGGHRTRRSTRVSEQLERARRRNIEQLAELRSREEQVERALRDYFVVREKISDATKDSEAKVAHLLRQVEQIRAETGRTVTGLENAAAHAALLIHQAGRTVPQVAELLGVPQKSARQLIRTGRTATAVERPRRPDGADDAADRHQSVPGLPEPDDPTARRPELLGDPSGVAVPGPSSLDARQSAHVDDEHRQPAGEQEQQADAVEPA
jgi:hypothetical protein